jgi:molecular chaperone Hsp33
MDKLVRGITENKEIRFIAIESTKVVAEAVKIHKLDPVSTIIMGRLLSGTLMMAAELKSNDNLITVKIESDGIIKTVLATADRSGKVKGFLQIDQSLITDPEEPLSLKETLGSGQLVVMKDLGMKKPYIGMVELKYGTIGKDLTYYYAKSEQTPSSVGLGVLLDDSGDVRQAGGFIIQLMPEASESTISRLEENLQKFPNFTDVMDMGYRSAEIIQDYLLKGLEPVILEKNDVQYHCDCSKAKFKEGLGLLPPEDLKEMIDEGNDITVNCHFCNSHYKFNVSDMRQILDRKENQ